MVLIQDASFEVPPIKTWKRKYVQLDFLVSIRELENKAKELRKESWKKRDWLDEKWLCMAFMKKCQCPFCKPGWIAYESAVKKAK